MRAAMRRWRRISAWSISGYLGFLAARRAIERSRSSIVVLLLEELSGITDILSSGPSLGAPSVSTILRQIDHVFRGLLRVLLVQHDSEQDPALTAFRREQKAIAVVH